MQARPHVTPRSHAFVSHELRELQAKAARAGARARRPDARRSGAVAWRCGAWRGGARACACALSAGRGREDGVRVGRGQTCGRGRERASARGRRRELRRRRRRGGGCAALSTQARAHGGRRWQGRARASVLGRAQASGCAGERVCRRGSAREGLALGAMGCCWASLCVPNVAVETEHESLHDLPPQEYGRKADRKMLDFASLKGKVRKPSHTIGPLVPLLSLLSLLRPRACPARPRSCATTRLGARCAFRASSR